MTLSLTQSMPLLIRRRVDRFRREAERPSTATGIKVHAFLNNSSHLFRSLAATQTYCTALHDHRVTTFAKDAYLAVDANDDTHTFALAGKLNDA